MYQKLTSHARLLFVVLFIWSDAVMAHPPLSNSRDFHLDAPCARVFPLFTAEGEKAWVPGWNPEMLSGATARGSVFRTKAHHDGRETVWIVSDYRPDQYRVAYARIAQRSNIGLVDVACRDTSGGARVTVRYTLTGLNEDGDDFVREFLSDAHYTRFIEEWRGALSDVLKK
ncbi:MAG TPA: hypothetical protein VGK80_06465 [Rhodanobacteraceae bacterium]